MIKFSKKLEKMRLHNGLTLQEVGDATGVTKAYIKQIETEHRPPSAALMDGLVQLFELNADDEAAFRKLAIASANKIVIDNSKSTDAQRAYIAEVAHCYQSMSAEVCKRNMKNMEKGNG